MDFLFYRAADGEDSVPDFSGRVFMRVIFPLKRTGNTLGWAEYLSLIHISEPTRH